jgi:hypothetical protein
MGSVVRIGLSAIMALVANAVVSAQNPEHAPIAVQGTARGRIADSQLRDPKPEAATRAVLSAFDRYEVVAVDAAHGNKDLDDFILHLLRDVDFPAKVNDIVVECGNALYQPILDRYIAGEDIPLIEVRPVWRNTTQPMCGVSGFYGELFPLIRRINQKLSKGKKIRVLAGDPPLDWDKVRDKSDVMLDRDAHIASVMQNEVLSRHRKALMLFGTFHLVHADPTAPRELGSAVERYERIYPRVTLVIGDQLVFSSGEDMAKYNSEEFEARMAFWPVPSLVQNIEGTWLADVDRSYFSEMVDAYLYLGPSNLLLAEPRPAEIFSNKHYMSELQRRSGIIDDPLITAATDPDRLSDENFSPFLNRYGDYPNLRPPGIGASPSGEPSGQGPGPRPKDLPVVIHLSPESLQNFTGKYAPELPSGLVVPPIDVVADQNQLWVELGFRTGKLSFVPISSTEFMMSGMPTTRIRFTENDKGRAVALVFHGISTFAANKLK